MANNYSAKAQALRDELASELAIRLPSIAQTKSFGASAECDLLLGAGTTTTDSVFVRIKVIDSIQKDVLGLAQQVFTPHVAQVLIELNATGANSPGTYATRFPVLAALVSRGVKVELYTIANGNSVSAAGITGTPAAVYETHVQYPMMASI
jgi:hypothetical protein